VNEETQSPATTESAAPAEAPTAVTAAPTPEAAAAATVSPTPVQVPPDVPTPPPAVHEQTAGGAAQVAVDRPELIVAGAFAAGFVIAMILKRLGQ
jgi:hypothetical protein